MLEHFLPKVSIRSTLLFSHADSAAQEFHNRPSATRANKTVPVGTGAWPPEVGIHRVVWNDGNGLARSPMLASATASGLCRVDWLLGRWGKDPQPYNGIEGMRGETTETFDEDEEDDDVEQLSE